MLCKESYILSRVQNMLQSPLASLMESFTSSAFSSLCALPQLQQRRYIRICRFSFSVSNSIGQQLKERECEQQWTNLKRMLKASAPRTSPEQSLKARKWVKLICGASFEDVVDVRNLSLVYTLAGVDCIDCAAEAAIVTAVNEGIDKAEQIYCSLLDEKGIFFQRPWVMISVNDNEDVHFRKAYFNPEDCPVDCSRPCERVCPADAIRFSNSTFPKHAIPGGSSSSMFEGVVLDRCYGCGRCIPVCPYDKISANSYVRNNVTVTKLLLQEDVHAIEIHTSAWHLDSFRELWSKISKAVENLKLVSVSLPDSGDLTLPALKQIYSIMNPSLKGYNLWQNSNQPYFTIQVNRKLLIFHYRDKLDGRPMTGDIGRGSTKDVIDFASRIALDKNRPPGFVQLAGGTNFHTIDLLKEVDFLDTAVSGIAYGGYARKIVGKVLHDLLKSQNSWDAQMHIEEYPVYLLQALKAAFTLLGPLKTY